MLELLDKIMLHPKTPKKVTRTLERVVRAGKSVRVSRDLSRRKDLVGASRGNPELQHVFDPVRGFGWLPKGTLSAVPAAIEFAKELLEERRHIERSENAYLIDLSLPTRYEEAKPLFDLALSDEVVQIATGYLGLIPILRSLRIWWTPVNHRMKGSQLYHRDGARWMQRRAKFIFAASDIDESSGPFTFLPADISERVSHDFQSFRIQDRVTDEDMYRYVNPIDELKLLGAAGSGVVLDSSRCFHFGARSRGMERLLVMFQFFNPLDLPPGQHANLKRSPAFLEKFGDDPVRMLLIPDDDSVDSAERVEMD